MEGDSTDSRPIRSCQPDLRSSSSGDQLPPWVAATSTMGLGPLNPSPPSEEQRRGRDMEATVQRVGCKDRSGARWRVRLLPWSTGAGTGRDLRTAFQLTAQARRASVWVSPAGGSWAAGAPGGPRGLWPQGALLAPLHPHPHPRLRASGLLERCLGRGARDQSAPGSPRPHSRRGCPPGRGPHCPTNTKGRRQRTQQGVPHLATLLSVWFTLFFSNFPL